MKSTAVASAVLALTAPVLGRVAKRQNACDAVVDGGGFASLNGGTTGGASGETVTATTFEELVEYAGAEGPLVIRVEGRITVEPLGHEISVASDKTVVGVGADAEIYQGGFRLIDVNNVIIRNLAIGHSNPGHEDNDFDGIQSDRSSNIWIDHCLFEETGDGLIDLRMDSTFWTVSNNILRGQNKAFGIGWTDNVVARGTLHHNWFDGTNQRNPSADNLAECHMYNNYLGGITSYGHHARGQTTAVIENVFFENSKDPLTKDPDAVLFTSGNIFENCDGTAEEGSDDAFDPSSYYDYQLTATEEVPAYVQANAGPQADICS